MLGSGAVNQETQYFGPGTRLLVLGELGPHRRVGRGMGLQWGAGPLAGFLLGITGLCSPCSDFLGIGSQLKVLGNFSSKFWGC